MKHSSNSFTNCSGVIFSADLREAFHIREHHRDRFVAASSGLALFLQFLADLLG